MTLEGVKLTIASLVFAALGLAAGLVFARRKLPAGPPPAVPPTPTPPPAPVPTPPPAPKPAGKWFDRVLVVVLENCRQEKALREPYLKALAARGVFLAGHRCITHPSQPNYLALWFASHFEHESNRDYNTVADHIGDRVERAGLTWKWYAEGHPGGIFLKSDKGKYCRKHVGALSALNVTSNTERCLRSIVPETTFDKDLGLRALPNVAFYSPDNNNNGHDTGVTYASRRLGERFGAVIDAACAPGSRDLVVVLFDEDNDDQNGLVYCALVGAGLAPKRVESHTDHYSLVRMILENFGLPLLGRYDASAPRVPLDA